MFLLLWRLMEHQKEQNNYLDLNKLLAGEYTNLDFERFLNIDYSDTDASLCGPVIFKGSVVDKSGYIELNANIQVDYRSNCARCLKPIDSKYSLDISYPIALDLQDEDNEDYIIPIGGFVDIEDLVYQNIVMNFPVKHLCSSHCKGLCPICGQNLNDGTCDCKKDIDPRLAGLADFFK